ncbi:hypothetical protein TWF718_001506 [Orbilia javanica]|uniref:Uncharacterized protein n=1 Tax=Orbilia javanica TaxID=47235 RepID=A0AAN8N8S1_9PEZI
MPVTKNKGASGSQPNIRVCITTQGRLGSRNNSPSRSSIAQRDTGASSRNTKQAQSSSTTRDGQSSKLPPTTSNNEAESSTKPGSRLLSELQDCPVEEIVREFTPRASETSPTRWAKLYEGARGYNRLMRWYDGPGDDEPDDGSIRSPGEPSGDDNKGKAAVSGQGSIVPTIESGYDQRNEASTSDSQISGNRTEPGPLDQENEDSDAITQAPFLPEVPADEFGKPIDMIKNPPPNEYTRAFPSSKMMPIPQNIQDKPFAYPGAHPHKMRWTICNHDAEVEVVCEETNKQNCLYNQNLKLVGMCENCKAAKVPDPTLTKGQKIRRSIKDAGDWFSRTARTIARGARRKPIPDDMREVVPPTAQSPTNVSDHGRRVGSPSSAGPSGTRRSFSFSVASGPGSTLSRSGHGGDGQSGDGQVFEGRGPAPGTAGLPLPNQPMTPEEQETVRKLRGPTGSSVGAGGADPTLHVDNESDKS